MDQGSPPDADAGYAPVPESARGVPIDPTIGWAAAQVRGGLYWITNGNEQAMFVVSNAGVIVVDAPEALGQPLRQAISAVTAQPISHIVYSHYHADHIGGAGVLATPGTTIVAHRATAGQLTRANDTRRPQPTVVFDDRYTLTVGDVTLELAYPGPSHVEGNIFIHAPAQRVLMAVDLVWPGWVPFFEFGQAKDLPGYRAAIDRILTYDFDTFIGGHVGRLGTRADVETTRQYVDDVFTQAQAALAAVSIYDAGRDVGFENAFLLVDTWFGRLARRCSEPIRRRWTGVLGAADVWPQSHCLAAIQSLRID